MGESLRDVEQEAGNKDTETKKAHDSCSSQGLLDVSPLLHASQSRTISARGVSLYPIESVTPNCRFRVDSNHSEPHLELAKVRIASGAKEEARRETEHAAKLQQGRH